MNNPGYFGLNLVGYSLRLYAAVFGVLKLLLRQRTDGIKRHV